MIGRRRGGGDNDRVHPRVELGSFVKEPFSVGCISIGRVGGSPSQKLRVLNYEGIWSHVFIAFLKWTA